MLEVQHVRVVDGHLELRVGAQDLDLEEKRDRLSLASSPPHRSQTEDFFEAV